MSVRRVVIVGGGFGGLYAARRLRRAPVEVTLIDRRNLHLFQPLRYQVATGGLSPGDIASPLRALEGLQVQIRTGMTVPAVGPGEVELRTGDGIERIATHTVLWAAGVQASPPAAVLPSPISGGPASTATSPGWSGSSSTCSIWSNSGIGSSS